MLLRARLPCVRTADELKVTRMSELIMCRSMGLVTLINLLQGTFGALLYHLPTSLTTSV